MKKILSGLGVGLLAMGFAQSAAADGMYRSTKDVAEIAPPVMSWNGLYIGGSIGYGVTTTEIDHFASITTLATTLATSHSDDISSEGLIGTVSVGYDREYAGFLFGVFADYTFGEMDGSGTLFADRPAPFLAYVEPYDLNYDNVWAVGLRMGLIREHNTLFYATVGYTSADLKFDDDLEEDLDGYFVGFGLEHRIRDGWTLKMEYRYSDYGDVDIFGATGAICAVGATCAQSIDGDTEMHTIRLGLAYKFGRHEEPIPMK